MKQDNFHTRFSKETWDEFKSKEHPGLLLMLNLIKLKENADYEDGRSASGTEAYQRYSDISAPIFQGLGGKIVWRGGHEMTMVGPEGENWDIAFVAEYPSIQDFITMMSSPTYREAMIHRQAGVLDSRLVMFRSEELGNSFAG